MIYVDYRDGSRELIPSIKALGAPVTEDNLDSADFAFTGNGINGDVLVGIERKTITDFISSRDEGRLVERQIPLMCEQYDDRYLIFEGEYKVSDDNDGLLLTLRWDRSAGKYKWIPMNFKNRYCTYRELDNMMTTFQRKRGFVRRETRDMAHTARVVVDLYWHYQAAWDDHKSDRSVGRSGPGNAFSFSVAKPSLVRLFASQIDGVGYERSALVAEKFATPLDMCLGSVKDWMEIKNIGKGIAERVVEQLTGVKDSLPAKKRGRPKKA